MKDSDAIMPSCMTEAFPKARKQHKCCECGRFIQPGETYQRLSGIWDHEPARFKTCAECRDLRARFMHFIEYEYYPPFGELFECMKEDGIAKESLPCVPPRQ